MKVKHEYWLTFDELNELKVKDEDIEKMKAEGHIVTYDTVSVHFVKEVVYKFYETKSL